MTFVVVAVQVAVALEIPFFDVVVEGFVVVAGLMLDGRVVGEIVDAEAEVMEFVFAAALVATLLFRLVVMLLARVLLRLSIVAALGEDKEHRALLFDTFVGAFPSCATTDAVLVDEGRHASALLLLLLVFFSMLVEF